MIALPHPANASQKVPMASVENFLRSCHSPEAMVRWCNEWANAMTEFGRRQLDTALYSALGNVS
jgi:hypothetical protein